MAPGLIARTSRPPQRTYKHVVTSGSLAAMSRRPVLKRESPPRRRYAARMPPEDRRQQLLDAALGVIIEQGYAGVSIEAIARSPALPARWSTTISQISACCWARCSIARSGPPWRSSLRSCPRILASEIPSMCWPAASVASSKRLLADPQPGASSCCRLKAPRRWCAGTLRPIAPGRSPRSSRSCAGRSPSRDGPRGSTLSLPHARFARSAKRPAARY